MGDIRLIRLKDDSKAVLEAGKQLNPFCEGMPALIQVVINHLVTNKGADLYNPDRGGNLGRMSRQYRVNSTEFKEAVSEWVKSVETYMIEEQTRKDFPISEQIDTLDLISIVSSSDDPTEVLIEIGLRNKAGDAYSITI